jgi:hypothetical protein
MKITSGKSRFVGVVAIGGALVLGVATWTGCSTFGAADAEHGQSAERHGTSVAAAGRDAGGTSNEGDRKTERDGGLLPVGDDCRPWISSEVERTPDTTLGACELCVGPSARDYEMHQSVDIAVATGDSFTGRLAFRDAPDGDQPPSAVQIRIEAYADGGVVSPEALTETKTIDSTWRSATVPFTANAPATSLHLTFVIRAPAGRTCVLVDDAALVRGP